MISQFHNWCTIFGCSHKLHGYGVIRLWVNTLHPINDQSLVSLLGCYQFFGWLWPTRCVNLQLNAAHVPKFSLFFGGPGVSGMPPLRCLAEGQCRLQRVIPPERVPVVALVTKGHIQRVVDAPRSSCTLNCQIHITSHYLADVVVCRFCSELGCRILAKRGMICRMTHRMFL